MPLVDPTTGEQYGTAPVSNEQDIDNAYAAAVRVFSDWKHSAPSHRQKALTDFADEVEKAAEALAATRVIGHASVAGDLTDALAEQARGAATTFGRLADDEDAWVPPVNNANRLQRVLGFLAEVPDHATVAVGGHRQGDSAYYIEPTVIGGLRRDDRLSQNEIFGPVITVQSLDDEDDVVRLANGVEYGLASSVWTKDVSVALRVSAALDFGCVWINTHVPLVAEMPHRGFKSSVHGKDLSMYGFEDYTRVKHVTARIS